MGGCCRVGYWGQLRGGFPLGVGVPCARVHRGCCLVTARAATSPFEQRPPSPGGCVLLLLLVVVVVALADR